MSMDGTMPVETAVKAGMEFFGSQRDFTGVVDDMGRLVRIFLADAVQRFFSQL